MLQPPSPPLTRTSPLACFSFVVVWFDSLLLHCMRGQQSHCSSSLESSHGTCDACCVLHAAHRPPRQHGCAPERTLAGMVYRRTVVPSPFSPFRGTAQHSNQPVLSRRRHSTRAATYSYSLCFFLLRRMRLKAPITLPFRLLPCHHSIVWRVFVFMLTCALAPCAVVTSHASTERYTAIG